MKCVGKTVKAAAAFALAVFFAVFAPPGADAAGAAGGNVGSAEGLAAALGGENCALAGESRFGCECVVLAGDAELGSGTVNIVKGNYVLDLNGHVLGGDSAVLRVGRGAGLTLCDSSEGSSGGVVSLGASGLGAVENYGSLRILGAGAENFGGGTRFAVYSEGDLVIESGDFSALFAPLGVFDGSAEIVGGTFSGSEYLGAFLCGGTLEIRGGEFFGGMKGVHVDNSSTETEAFLKIDGGSFVGEELDGLSVYAKGSVPVKVEVSGGSFFGGDDGLCLYAAEDCVTLNGGSFAATGGGGAFGGVVVLLGVYGEDGAPESELSVLGLLGEDCGFSPANIGTVCAAGEDGFYFCGVTGNETKVLGGGRAEAERMTAVLDLVNALNFPNAENGIVGILPEAIELAYGVLNEGVAAGNAPVYSSDSIEIVPVGFAAAEAGDSEYPEGRDGSFSFFVRVNGEYDSKVFTYIIEAEAVGTGLVSGEYPVIADGFRGGAAFETDGNGIPLAETYGVNVSGAVILVAVMICVAALGICAAAAAIAVLIKRRRF